MSERFCKDCKHASGDVSALTCEAPQNYVEHVDRTKYLVTGLEQAARRVRRGASCMALRQPRPAEIEATVCAPAGKWFEPKEEK